MVSSTACNWRLIFAGSSYRHLLAQAEEDLISTSRPSGSVAEAAALLAAAGKIAGAPVDLVAVDMPLSLEPITARRASDNLVSAAYGARHCSTPNVTSSKTIGSAAASVLSQGLASGS